MPRSAAQRERRRLALRAWRAAHPGYDKAWRAAHADSVGQSQKTYHERHREVILLKKRAHHAANKALHNAISRAWHAAHRAERHSYYMQHRERHRATMRAYNEAHPGAQLARQRAYHARNPDYGTSSRARRRARKANAPLNDLSAAQWKEIKLAYGHRCVYCGKKMQRLTQDHIIPLAHGGSHTLANVVPACQSCNSRKYLGKPLVPVQPLLLTIALPQGTTPTA